MHALLDRLGWRGWVLPLMLLVLAEAAMRMNPVESDVLALRAAPGERSSLAQTFEVNLPRPRDQLSTREEPEFLRLRRAAFDHVKDTH